MDFTYCPFCGAKLVLKGGYPHCEHDKRTFYKNSKPTASILPIKEGKVLLAKRAIEPFKGAYDAIGGYLNAGEHPEAGALREALEETGLEMRITELVGMYIDEDGYNKGDYTLNIFYRGEIVGNESTMFAMDDVDSLEWVDILNLPEWHGFENGKAALRDLQEWYKERL